MIKSLIVICSFLNAVVLTLKFSDVINFSKQYMEVPIEANKLASNLSSEEKAGLKVLWFNFELLPVEAKEIINNLNDKEITVLTEVGSATASDSEEEFVAEVTKKSPELGAKIKKVNDMMDKKIATLKPEGQAFTKKIMDFVEMSKYFDNPKEASPSAVKDLTLGVIEKYKTLSDNAKEDIKKEFPALAAFLTSEETVKRLQEH
ncbi:unnamed protein product [Cylicocyclus nassatus]|uniref:Nematode fatty acid retinoid binding protein n=1 Tax=Cylicocyclus nassatus TaxID=53992 RepID=A0AA36M624_CYLNA|nr:unnamed protein product [Cylicocyclus nassatus]